MRSRPSWVVRPCSFEALSQSGRQRRPPVPVDHLHSGSRSCSYDLAVSLRLKEGVLIEDAAEGLRAAAMEARNPLPPGFAAAVNHYLSWTNNQAESVIRNCLVDPRLWISLRGDSYWHIQSMSEVSPRWNEINQTEMKRQAEYLEGLQATLQRSSTVSAPPLESSLSSTHTCYSTMSLQPRWRGPLLSASRTSGSSSRYVSSRNSTRRSTRRETIWPTGPGDF